MRFRSEEIAAMLIKDKCLCLQLSQLEFKVVTTEYNKDPKEISKNIAQMYQVSVKVLESNRYTL